MVVPQLASPPAGPGVDPRTRLQVFLDLCAEHPELPLWKVAESMDGDPGSLAEAAADAGSARGRERSSRR